MTVQIAALVFIGLWACWGCRVYEEREGVFAALFGGLVMTLGTYFALIIAALVGSAAMGYFS